MALERDCCLSRLPFNSWTFFAQFFATAAVSPYCLGFNVLTFSVMLRMSFVTRSLCSETSRICFALSAYMVSGLDPSDIMLLAPACWSPEERLSPVIAQHSEMRN